MGWLELLPLLKRMLPLLSRIAPMLEAWMTARGAVREEGGVAFERFSGELKGDFAIAAQNHVELKRLLQDHTEHLMVLGDDVKQLRIADGQYGARLEQAEQQIASLARLVRIGFALIFLMLLVCVGLLVALYVRR